MICVCSSALQTTVSKVLFFVFLFLSHDASSSRRVPEEEKKKAEKRGKREGRRRIFLHTTIYIQTYMSRAACSVSVICLYTCICVRTPCISLSVACVSAVRVSCVECIRRLPWICFFFDVVPARFFSNQLPDVGPVFLSSAGFLGLERGQRKRQTDRERDTCGEERRSFSRNLRLASSLYLSVSSPEQGNGFHLPSLPVGPRLFFPPPQTVEHSVSQPSLFLVCSSSFFCNCDGTGRTLVSFFEGYLSVGPQATGVLNCGLSTDRHLTPGKEKETSERRNLLPVF